jgi:3-hydroxyisobutyrate dehydrogenase-like beta-hydroxyacid dehydrogenase
MCLATAGISPDLAKTMAGRFEKAGDTYISAPVLGGPAEAEVSQLNIPVGGDRKSMTEVTPLLKTMSIRVCSKVESKSFRARALSPNSFSKVETK